MCIRGVKELNDPSETLSLTYWCGNNAWAAAALRIGLEDTGGTTGYLPITFAKGILLSGRVPFAIPARRGFMTHRFRGGTRPVTKPLAGRVGARIVGTVGSTARRPRLS